VRLHDWPVRRPAAAPHADARLQVDLVLIGRDAHLVEVREGLALAARTEPRAS
jgi:hypothetical protein